MKERPILFSAPMVRAILAGTKTQTRRIVKVRDVSMARSSRLFTGEHFGTDAPQEFCPYGQVGDRLWVKENHASIRQEQIGTGAVRWVVNDDNGNAKFCGALYAADGSEKPKGMRWRPSIHMPRCLSRITLEITGVRVERLHAITEDDARAEGVEPYRHAGGKIDYRTGFALLWDDINGRRAPFDESPWVWVVEFKRIESQVRAA